MKIVARFFFSCRSILFFVSGKQLGIVLFFLLSLNFFFYLRKTVRNSSCPFKHQSVFLSDVLALRKHDTFHTPWSDKHDLNTHRPRREEREWSYSASIHTTDSLCCTGVSKIVFILCCVLLAVFIWCCRCWGRFSERTFQEKKIIGCESIFFVQKVANR